MVVGALLGRTFAGLTILGRFALMVVWADVVFERYDVLSTYLKPSLDLIDLCTCPK